MPIVYRWLTSFAQSIHDVELFYSRQVLFARLDLTVHNETGEDITLANQDEGAQKLWITLDYGTT